MKDIKIDNNHKIDYLLFTPFEIYSISVLAIPGYISGMESEDIWRQAIAFQKKKNALANPIKENMKLKQTIRESYKSERTQLGKSVLKQLMEAIQ